MDDIFSKWGLPEDATDRDITQAYRRRAQRMHPDRIGNSKQAQEDFCKLQDEYAILKDPIKRKLLLEDIKKSKTSNAQSADFIQTNKRGDEFYNNIYEKRENNKRFYSEYINQTHIPAGNLNLILPLSLKEALNGGSCFINTHIASPCGCNRSIRCQKCRGTGQVFIMQKISVKWPAGIKDGQTLIIKEAGHRGTDSVGDLNLSIKWIETNGWYYDGINLRLSMKVAKRTWNNGGEIWFLSPREEYGFLLLNPQKYKGSSLVLKIPNMGFEEGGRKSDVYIDLSVGKSYLSLYYTFIQKTIKLKAHIILYKNKFKSRFIKN